ncbi:MAG: SWIB/MDM2 domain-containing protein [Nevskia sp.]|nr:SWIB/MDM2 domain-containing protein [Nevskia sp.]
MLRHQNTKEYDEMPAKKGRSGKAIPAKKGAKKVVVKKAVKKAAAKKKAAPKKPAARTAAAKKTRRKANPALLAPKTPSATLAAVIGAKPEPRGQIVKKLWAYIRKNGLQDPVNKRNINADDKLKAVFGGKSTVNMFEMTKLVSKHVN